MAEGRTHKPVVETRECRTCMACVGGCPAEFIPEYRKEPLSLRGALYSGGTRWIRGKGRTDFPPCQAACPVKVETRQYTRLIAERRFLEALDVIRKDLPFPGVIGRICHHPCEEACLRGESLDEAVSLCDLKRFVADYEVGKREIPILHTGEQKNGTVAVIGGGPSGMACALDLRNAGYRVTIFEGSNRLGGMLFWGIPAYRLPRDVLEREVSLIEKAGITVRYSTKVGKDASLKDIYKEFDAVYLGCGAQKGTKLGVDNETARGVMSSIELLRRTAEGQTVTIGRRVVVVGGGNVAVDTALTVKRLGAKDVWIVCLEKRQEMPAGKAELEQAAEEHVKILARWAPKRITALHGKVKAVELKRCTSVFDHDGRFSPVFDEKIKKALETDMIVTAIGQAPEVDFLRELEGLEMEKSGWVKTDPETLETTIPGIFAGGDIIAGPGMAITAVADGKKAAASIDRYLSTRSRPAREADKPVTGGVR
jgi:NADPH-dependent glutamate synthase beta subunit-like oxidoreductase